jgi:hypothetical protein
MKRFSKIVVLVLLVFFTGCHKSQKPVSIALEGSPETVAAAKDWLEKNPQAAQSALGGEFIIKNVEPDSKLDHKIVIISPDPGIDFKILVINPQATRMTPQMRELSRDIAESIRRDLQRQMDINTGRHK